VQPLVEAAWGSDTLNLGDPWGLNRIVVGGVSITQRDLWAIGVSVAVLGIVFFVFARTRIGLAMRAAASDPEAATAQGISPKLAQGVSWALAGGLAALAGVLLATAVGGGVRPGLAAVAFAALPAIYLGGVGSPAGAVVGGLTIGLTQQWAAGYAPAIFGQGFSAVFPYLVMVLVLLVRPQGLFGAKTVSRA
jgi:branched-chain amino acid transport system permease protein